MIESACGRRSGRRRGFALLAGLALLTGMAGSGLAQTAGQNLIVIDGDTLQSDGEILQLYGIDAPELGQLCLRQGKPWQCGVEAAFALQKLISLSGTAVSCEPWRDRSTGDGQDVRVCQLGKDQELGLSMLRNGYAMALPGSFPYYGQMERQARQTGLGIWSSEVTPPWEWREGQRIARQIGQLGEDCNVKGVVDEDGARIYLVPTDRDFAKVTVDQTKGGQLFCSDEEAREAGWRRRGEAAPPAVQ